MSLDILVWFALALVLLIGQTFLALAALGWFINWCGRNEPTDPWEFDEFNHGD